MRTRTTAEIDSDINAAKLQLTKLNQERAEAVEYLEECGCEDIADIPAIEAQAPVHVRYIWAILDDKENIVSHLSPEFTKEDLAEGFDALYPPSYRLAKFELREVGE